MKYYVSLKYLSLWPIAILIVGLLLMSWYLMGFAVLAFVAVYVRSKFTFVTIMEDKIQYATGILMQEKQDVFFSKINNINFSQNIVQKWMDVGSIEILTGNDSPVQLIVFQNATDLLEKINSQRSSQT